jgi:general stress protein YciG
MVEVRRTVNPGNFAADRAKASRAGQVGGQRSSGNFAKDRDRAAEAGRKGGENSRGGGRASRKHNDDHDKAVEDSFPASDPPASSGIVGPCARQRPLRPKGNDHHPLRSRKAAVVGC